jgi:holo-[acyl-carrier protein] synthase
LILGIGSDLTDIRRIERTLERHGQSSPTASSPRPSAPRRAAPHAAATYAKRFAAKEACAKALGTGMRRGVFWRDMGVVNAARASPRSRSQAAPPSGWRP